LERPGSWANLRGQQDSGRVNQRELLKRLTCRGLREDQKRDGGSVFPAHVVTTRLD
jgi:hypothetical protein